MARQVDLNKVLAIIGGVIALLGLLSAIIWQAANHETKDMHNEDIKAISEPLNEIWGEIKEARGKQEMMIKQIDEMHSEQHKLEPDLEEHD